MLKQKTHPDRPGAPYAVQLRLPAIPYGQAGDVAVVSLGWSTSAEALRWAAELAAVSAQG
jgi:hypothetical protein